MMYNQIENRLKGFISYSHDDAKDVEALKNELETFVTNQLLTIWYDRMIDVGTKWEPQIETQLNSSDIIIFCITSSFLKSKSCRDEFRKVIELKRETYAEIISVILKECEWESEKEISDYQVIPEYGKPVMKYEAQQEAYRQIMNVLDSKIKLVLRRKMLKMTSVYEEELQSLDPLLSVSGAENLNLRLEDIYVDLELNNQLSSETNNNTIQGRELVNKLICGVKIFLSGDAQSGKTSLCKRLCFDIFARCFVPVYLAGKEPYQGDATRMIERAMHQQYDDADCIDRERIVLILDDFYKCRNPEKFLNGLPTCCSVVLVFDDVYGLNLKSKAIFHEYAPFSILPLRARKRDELIKKWLAANNDEHHIPFDNYKSHDELVARVEATLGRSLGRGLIPAYPFYILSILITSEIAMKPLNQDISSQGYCYQALLYAVLWRVGVKNRQIDVYVNFLTELAYMLFKNSSSLNCTEDELNLFLKEYEDRFTLPVSVRQILENLERARIFSKNSFSYYDFHYPYLKFYFIAKYLSEHFNECGSDFERVFSHLGSISNAYIAIFVAHHERSIQYLNVIEEKANKLFNSVQGSYLSDSDMQDFDKQSQFIIKATLPKSDNNPEEERDKILIEKEKIEAVRERESGTEEENAESVAEIRDFISAIRICQVLGQILKTRPGSIQKDMQKKLILCVVDVYARILRMFLDTFKENETRELIVERITFILGEILKKKGNLEDKEKIREKAIQVFWNLNYITIYGLMLHCVYSIGANELSSVIRSACESRSNAPLLKIIPYVVEIIYKKQVNIDGMKKIFPVLPETVRNMLKFVVVGFCKFHNITFKERQQVEALFKLRKNLLPKHLSSTE